MSKRLLFLAVICCSFLSSKGTDVTLNLVSSNQFKLGTNGIYQAALVAIGSATNINNYTTNLVSVLSYGAISDGITDNQVAISNAWSSIASGSGKILFFPPGVYKARQLNLTGVTKNDYTIYGPGATLKPFETNQWQISLTGSRITFKDITFDADFKTYYNIFQNNGSPQWTLINCKYYNAYLDNNMDPGGTGGVVNHLVRKGCEGTTWLSCIFSNTTFSTTGNVSRFCKQILTQITTTNAVDWVKNLQIIGNKFYACTGDGQTEGDCVEIQGPNGNGWDNFQAVIIGNAFDGYTRRGFKLIGNGCIVANNTFYTTITNTFQYGAISAYGANNVIVGNIIKSPFFAAIDCNTAVSDGPGTNNVISDNTIFYTGGSGGVSRGIRLDSGSTNISVMNNIIANAAIGVSTLSGVDQIDISNNKILNCGYGVFVGTNGVSSATPQNIFISNNSIQGGTNGVKIDFGTNIVTRFNHGISSSTYISRAGGVTGQSFFNGLTTPSATTATLDFGSIAGATSADLTITVTGAAVGDPVSVSLPSAPTAGIVFNTFVSAADTVTIRAFNITAAPIDPVSASYKVEVFKD